MKIKKILAAVAAAAVAVSTMAVNVFAADYTAKLGFADMSWSYQDWDSSVQVTGDGQYSIETSALAGSPDFGVFVIDIEGMFAGNPDATAVLDSIEIDGSAIDFDADKIMYGDIEEKGNYRIDIYNQYSDTKDNPGVNQATAIGSTLKITFTVSGLGGGDTAAADTADTASSTEDTTTPAADSNTSSATTGNAPVAAMVSVMAVAGAAVIASRKRK
ncbi:MAG: hypothetical protein K2H23_03265 [Oscillospiraceae bacterium]|nr:hypothetical protein [Oscillospiraceae bacterium]